MYGIEAVVDMAKMGDRRALLEASMISSLPFEYRKTLAIAAAKQGYTAALMKLGASKLMQAGRIELPTQLDDDLSLDPQDAIWGFALVVAARDLDDSGAIAWLSQGDLTLFAAERRLAERYAAQTVTEVTSRTLQELLNDIQGGYR